MTVEKLPSATNTAPVNITTIRACITHVNRASMVPVEAFKVTNGSTVQYTPTAAVEEDARRKLKEDPVRKASLTPSSPAAAIPLSVIIRAFRAQLGISAPEFQTRKWSLYCGFEGTSVRGGASSAIATGPSRRTIPLMRIDLPQSVTAATPMMTPAASADTSGFAGAAAETVPINTPADSVSDESGKANVTLGELLAPLVTPTVLESLQWTATLSFVVGEDEEEERKRRAEMRAASVAVSEKKPKKLPEGAILEPNFNGMPPGFGMYGQNTLFGNQPSAGLFGGNLEVPNFGAPAPGFGPPGGLFHQQARPASDLLFKNVVAPSPSRAPTLFGGPKGPAAFGAARAHPAQPAAGGWFGTGLAQAPTGPGGSLWGSATPALPMQVASSGLFGAPQPQQSLNLPVFGGTLGM